MNNAKNRFSNHWKLSQIFFQSLEIFSDIFPIGAKRKRAVVFNGNEVAIIGNFFRRFSNWSEAEKAHCIQRQRSGNHWKMAFLQFCILHIAFSTFAAVPQPMVIYCGQATDGYGWPYTRNATVILMSGTNEITRQEISGSISPGINFMLYCNLDDNGRSTRYDPSSVVTGQPVSIIIQDAYGQQTIMQSNSIPDIGVPGSVNIINVTAGVDSDGDGLPDLWEQELVDASNGALTNIVDVRPEDDFDQDGVNNGNEYRSGTFAFLDYDYFYVDHIEVTTNNWFDINFISVPGKPYQLQTSDLPATDTWSDCSYALTPEGDQTSAAAIGNGNRLHLFIPPQTNTQLFRVVVE